MLLLHDMLGLNDVMRAAAERLAEEGYVCLVPDLYWRLAPGASFSADGADLERAQALRDRYDFELGLRDVAASLDTLRGLEERRGKLGLVGFSMGGLLAMRGAAHLAVDCAVAYYAVGLEQHCDDLRDVRCPSLLHVGDADTKVPPASREQLASALVDRPHIELVTYPGSAHGFCLGPSSNAPPWVKPPLSALVFSAWGAPRLCFCC